MKNNSKETERIKEPSKFAIKFANTVFMLGILFSVLITVYAVYQKNNSPDYSSTFYYSFILFAVLAAALFGLGLRSLRNELKVNMSVLFITTGISVYGFETYLQFNGEPKTRKSISEQLKVPYDTRTLMEVYDDLIDSGIKAYPAVYPFHFISSNGLNTTKGKLYPLGGISSITTILSNESGYYPIIKTDEHGFNNPKGLYEINKVDIVLIGDSMAEGDGVNSNETIGAVIRELGFNAISIGKSNNGPLIELGALKEYAEPLKPKIVLWLYFYNDIENLNSEINSSFLKKYLIEDGFSQNLISRQEEIDSLLVNYVEEMWKRKKESEKESEKKVGKEGWIIPWVFKISRLYNLRSRINLRPTLAPTPTPVLKDILRKSKQMSSEWGGKMYFVYLPSYSRYSTGIEDRNREFVLHFATDLEIPIIDIHKEVFVTQPDPLSLFPFRMNGHFNAEGYRLIAKAIGKRLVADGIIPPK